MKPHFFGLAVLVTSLAQGAVPADPWTLVPPFPTGCYASQDDFDEVVDKRIELLSAEIKQQDKINEETRKGTLVKDSAGNVDPWAMAAQMTQNAMQNPQATMQASQASDESVTSTRQADQQQADKDRVQKDALAKHIARYEAAFHAATTTTYRFWFGSSEGRDRPLGDGVLPNGGTWYFNTGNTDESVAQALAYSRKVDQVYASQICPQWWKAGPFQTWLTGYRSFLSADVPRQEQADATQVAGLKLQGASLERYHSTANMKAVRKYLQSIREVYRGNVDYAGRWERPGQPPAQ